MTRVRTRRRVSHPLPPSPFILWRETRSALSQKIVSGCSLLTATSKRGCAPSCTRLTDNVWYDMFFCFILCIFSPPSCLGPRSQFVLAPAGGGDTLPRHLPCRAVPVDHRLRAGLKVKPSVWTKDKHKDQDGHDVWRHVDGRYLSRQRHPTTLDPASSAVVYGRPLFYCDRFPVLMVFDHQCPPLC
jgi:hypothetical protein